jgi:flagellar biosynthesis/type III secretory pathway M-ring protein FliF/YscJ
MNPKEKLPPQDQADKEKPDNKKDANLKSQDEQLARIVTKLSEEDPAMIAEVIKKWLEENKK